MALKNLIDILQNENILKSIHIGKVVDNIDPLKIGRVRVQIDSLHKGLSKDMLPWSHQIFNVGTGENTKSVPNFIVPGIGTKVMVIFPTEDIYSSFYIGQLLLTDYDFMELNEDYPNTYGFQDKIGNKYWINMTKGTIDFEHFSGTHLNIDKQGNITILGEKNEVIHIKGNVTTKIDGNWKVDINGTTTINSGGNMKITAPRIDLN